MSRETISAVCFPIEEQHRELNARLRTTALVAREGGLCLLADLMNNPKINLVQVFTHRKLPKAEGGGERSELSEFHRLVGGKLTTLDFPEAKNIDEYLVEVDLLIAVSWRFLVPVTALKKAKYAINIHRGELPKYAGAEPIKRALENGETRTAVTAHRMTAGIDEGPEIARVWQEMPPSIRYTDEYVKILIKRQAPLYGPLSRLAIDAVQVLCP